MGKHVVFFVHGMGRHDGESHKPGLKVLQGALTQYESFAGDDLPDLIQAVPVVYDDVIEVWRQRMSADFAAFRGALLGQLDAADSGKKGSIERQLNQIESWIGAGEPGFVWTHAADVMIYRWMSTLRMAIDVSVAMQIMNTLKGGGFSKWSVIGHSLGTSVVHNVVNMLYTEGTPDHGPLDPRELRPRVLMMVANVTRVLQRPGAKVYDSRVRPGDTSGGALCSYYLNARHKLDPFVHPKPFTPDLWPEPGSFSLNIYQHLQPAHIHFSKENAFRVHDLDHYVSNPRVHVPLFRALFGESRIRDDEFAKAKTLFDSQIVAANIDAARAKLEGMLPAPTSNWQMLIALIKRIRS